MLDTHSRRGKRLRSSGPALPLDVRERIRERATIAGIGRVAAHLGVTERTVLLAASGIPSNVDPIIVARLAERGLP